MQTGAIKDLKTHPVKLYVDLGLRVTINTDNRLITDTSVSKELWLCHTEMGFTLKDLKQVVLAGFKSSFLPFHVKQEYLRRTSLELERFHEDGTIDDELPAIAYHSRRGREETPPPPAASASPAASPDKRVARA